MLIGMAADHGGYHLKEIIKEHVRMWGFEVCDFGAYEYKKEDDFPDVVIPLAKAIHSRKIDRGIAICGSGVGACVAVNKIRGVRGALVNDIFSAHQGVEDDDMNVICLGARVIGEALAIDLVRKFLFSQFSGKERFLRRLRKIEDIEE